jgi:multidrug resistance efflux pump
MALRTSRADVEAAEKEVKRWAKSNSPLRELPTDAIGLKQQQPRALEEDRRTALARLQEAQANLTERLIAAPGNGTVVSRWKWATS